MSKATRIGLWFGSLLLGITRFRVLITMSPILGISGSFRVEAVLLVFRTASVLGSAGIVYRGALRVAEQHLATVLRD